MVEKVSWLQIVLVFTNVCAFAFLSVLLIVMWRRISEHFHTIRKTAELHSRGIVLSLKRVNEVGDTVRLINNNSQEQLSFQKKAHDQQRVMIASLIRQTLEISGMLESVPQKDRHAGRMAMLDTSEKNNNSVRKTTITPETSGKIVGMNGAPTAQISSLEEWYTKGRAGQKMLAADDEQKVDKKQVPLRDKRFVALSTPRSVDDLDAKQGRAVANG